MVRINIQMSAADLAELIEEAFVKRRPDIACVRVQSMATDGEIIEATMLGIASKEVDSIKVSTKIEPQESGGGTF